MRHWAVAGILLATGAGAAEREVTVDWRRVATAADRQKLREWRSAWSSALRDARGDKAAMAAITGDAALFDPDRSLTGSLPAPGNYRCRTTKLGRQGVSGSFFVTLPWTACRIETASTAVLFTGLGVGQRPIGMLYADTDARTIFLGSMMLTGETRAMAYGRDPGRDMAGILERIGERRWRLVLPHPAFQSQLDLIEIEPAA
ncbi:hypothetical protein ASG67_11205 [Sphingomonas sp. Leaf339]|uniref:DUF4893 domain-containing protein n=1 Tax=Sphingomonas sp. Leaf339 TaxID=1736343 RepID=UPI0006FA09C3|nr:DUF4893 domain-containing protein [Sphingomonas sp. Leaf339]KQU49680.1 hypothetical protein ASG67_11205 [Sphingomonas sp. Leaf339]